jgi:hypothetical protein
MSNLHCLNHKEDLMGSFLLNVHKDNSQKLHYPHISIRTRRSISIIVAFANSQGSISKITLHCFKIDCAVTSRSIMNNFLISNNTSTHYSITSKTTIKRFGNFVTVTNIGMIFRTLRRISA